MSHLQETVLAGQQIEIVDPFNLRGDGKIAAVVVGWFDRYVGESVWESAARSAEYYRYRLRFQEEVFDYRDDVLLVDINGRRACVHASEVS